MRARTIGLLHPGAMGVTVGMAAAHNVEQVVWASESRSDATKARAQAADLRDLETLEELVRASDLLISVCPPGSAAHLAREVSMLDFEGVYLDANAVSPETVRRMAEQFDGSRTLFVDGGIIGPPATQPGTTRLHLSGSRAAEIAACFALGNIEARVVNGPPGAASALKMVFAAYTKGVTALLASIHAVARREGVHDALMCEWEKFLPDLPRRSAASIPGGALKAWRFVGEMEEIASTFEASALPGGFHRAAAEVYSRLAGFKDSDVAPSIEEVAARLISTPS